MDCTGWLQLAVPGFEEMRSWNTWLTAASQTAAVPAILLAKSCTREKYNAWLHYEEKLLPVRSLEGYSIILSTNMQYYL